jgi:predicted fused transcriptional regulator/phosphomethylpyrimidine kinase
MLLKEGPVINAARNLAYKLTEKILNSSTADDELIKDICHTCMSLRIGSHICKLHQEKVPILGDLNCQICSELLGGQEADFTKKAEVIGDMQEALRLIESSPHFSKIVPQVRANLVACDEDAISTSEVASIPGRITLVSGRARVLMGPQFGTSQHTASLLLWAKTIWKHVRACICISGNNDVITSAKKYKIRIFQTSRPARNVDEIINLGKEAVTKRSSKTKYPALHVPGGIGVEPILYVFGSSATSLSTLCLKLSETI